MAGIALPGALIAIEGPDEGRLKRFPFRWSAPLRVAGMVVLVALSVAAMSRPSFAVCDPAANTNPPAATCSGTTVNQGPGSPNIGYGGAAFNFGVTVLPGATVTGTNAGIFADTATVTNFGNIQGISAIGLGISATTATIINSGTISGSIFGISGTTANVTNSGSIFATAANGVGIGVVTAVVNNSGTISGGATGIGAVTANVTNSGTISGGNTGVAATTANVTNSGTISGGDTGVGGITANVSNSGTISGGRVGVGGNIINVVNSGTVSGNSFGITGDTVSLINTGAVSGNVGFQAGIGNVTNAGTIIGTGGTALRFGAAASTLTLLPGSRIFGAIDMGGGPDFVNVVTGRDISWLVTLSNFAGTINVSGGQPFVISGNQIATLDPTLFATFDRALMDFSRGVSSAIPMFEGFSNMPGGSAIAFAAPQSPASRVEEVFASIPGLSAYAADPMAFKNPTVVLADGAALWARGFGGERIQPSDGILFKATSDYYGGMMGGDWLVRPELRLGAFIGGGATRTSLDQNAGWANSDLIFGGGFARYAFGKSFLQAAVQGGPSQNSTSRTIASNLAPNLQAATANYDGWYISPEMTYGLRHSLGSYNGVTWTMMPNLRVRYLYGAFDGYTETGSNANLTVAGRAVQDLEERGEVKLIAQTLYGVWLTRVNVYGGALGVQRLGDFTVNSLLLGLPLPFATPGKDDVWGGFGGGGLEVYAGSVGLFAGAEWLSLSDSSTVVSGKGGLRVSF
ncbi:MAG: autotransporter domain-containing protein [Rhodoplanes sp.]